MKIVVKFGGSSLASAEQFKKVADIIHADPHRRFFVDNQVFFSNFMHFSFIFIDTCAIINLITILYHYKTSKSTCFTSLSIPIPNKNSLHVP